MALHRHKDTKRKLSRLQPVETGKQSVSQEVETPIVDANDLMSNEGFRTAFDAITSEARKKFVFEYLVDFNGQQAGERSGWTKTSAKISASRALTEANVAICISIGARTIQNTTMALAKHTREYIVDRLILNVERSMQHQEVLDHEGNGTGEFRYHPTAVNQGLNLLGKSLPDGSMFQERVVIDDSAERAAATKRGRERAKRRRAEREATQAS